MWFKQCKAYRLPEADHDDGPDALHMLWMAATSGRATENMRAYEIPVAPFTI